MITSQVPHSSDIEVVLLGQDGFARPEGAIGTNQLVARIRDFTSSKKNSVVLLDGIHYLVTNLSFEGFLKTLFEINDIVSKNKAILLVRLDPSLLDSSRMAFVENELFLLPSQKIEDIIIGDESYDLLRFVYEQNQNNALVSVKKIMSKFQISYVTAAKRIESLESDGLVYVKKQGKLRTSYIADKGKSLLHKRRAA
jgi:predicted transcriptional regulator